MPRADRYVRRPAQTITFVAFCRVNGPCDHEHATWDEARACAVAADGRAGHFHAIKEASRISGRVYDRMPTIPSRTANGDEGHRGAHPLTGAPC